MGKKETRLKGAIFDLDGVLVNTVPLHFKAWKKMFGEYGKKFTFQDYKDKVDGIPRLNGAGAILKELSDKELEEAAARKQRYFLDFLKAGGVEVFKDALNLIKRLKKDGVRVAVISSSKNCLFILKKVKLENLFDVIITGNDIKRGKPHPDIFLSACKRTGLLPSECVVFEDAILGIEAANRGNFISVGVDRHKNPKRLNKANLVVDRLSKINLKKLKELFG